MTWSPRSSSPLAPLCGRARTMTETFSPTSLRKVRRLKSKSSAAVLRYGTALIVNVEMSASLLAALAVRPQTACFFLVSPLRFWLSGIDDVSARVPRRQDHRGRGRSWHCDQALPRAPEGKSPSFSILGSENTSSSQRGRE